MKSPHMEQFTARKRDVLVLTDPMDEFIMQELFEYKGMKFVNIDAPDADVEPDLEPDFDAAKSGLETGNKDSPVRHRALTEKEQDQMVRWLRETLGERVATVKFTTRYVVCTSAGSPHSSNTRVQSLQTLRSITPRQRRNPHNGTTNSPMTDS